MEVEGHADLIESSVIFAKVNGNSVRSTGSKNKLKKPKKTIN